MVIADKPKRSPQPKVECGCGAMIAPKGQQMHETSNFHKAWAGENEVPAVEVLDEEQINILDMARTGEDPRSVARMVRALFSRRRWPNEEHPGEVRNWLEQHNIPQINLPRHSSPDDARRYSEDEMNRILSEGWGKTWEVR